MSATHPRRPEREPGDPIAPCQDAPTLRARDPEAEYQPTEEAEGYTSRGHIQHFLEDREVNLAALNKALADVFGEPGLRTRRLELEIDEDYWRQICGDPWSGNIYRYNF